MADPGGVGGLAGVPETALWTLYQRAGEARRPDAVLHDPWAVELVERIEGATPIGPLVERFGPLQPVLSQGQALRARTFDLEVARYLARHPGAVVVALGEGLETQRWRVDDGRVRWVTVDLPRMVELRASLLPAAERATVVAASVLDRRWLDEVPAGDVLVTAQGLLMYLQPPDVHALLGDVVARLPRAPVLFDTVAGWISRRTLAGTTVGSTGYRPPPMPWGWSTAEEAALRSLPGVGRLDHLHRPRGRGPLFGWLAPALDRVPGLAGRSPLPAVHVLDRDRS
jgi:O-methyltransferase involved in polyketide biosynthesis